MSAKSSIVKSGNTKNNDADEDSKKGWDSFPMVHMSQDNRIMVEGVIKSLVNVYPMKKSEHDEMEIEKVREELVKMGFRPSHVNEALEYAGNRTEALDWLSLYVPEDDLPAIFLQKNYNPNLQAQSYTSMTLSQSWILDRLTDAGFPRSAAKQALDDTEGDEHRAIDSLLWQLVYVDEERTQPQSLDELGVTKKELEEIWEDEIIALHAVFDERFERIGERAWRVKIQETKVDNTFLEITVPTYSLYPYVPPLIVLRSPALPAYIKLAVMKKLWKDAELNFLGVPMGFELVEWVEANLQNMIDNPPRLREATETKEKDENISVKAEKTLGNRTKRNDTRSKSLSAEIKGVLTIMRDSKEYQPIKIMREKLPAWKFRETVVNMVNNNQVVIVSGETGCGKTTQVPQFILDSLIDSDQGASASLICTQPRRISAMGVADRVSTERCERIGISVGYAIRGETKSSFRTKLLFCTTGVLLQRLMNDSKLEGITHVFVDEVHERSVDGDFLLIILKDLLKQRKDLKLVLMSATINQELFSNYFNGAPCIEIPGFTHPIKEFHLENILQLTGHKPSFHGGQRIPKSQKESPEELEKWRSQYQEDGFEEPVIRSLEFYKKNDRIDYELVAAVVKYIIENQKEGLEELGGGAVLVFMPGVMEIKRCIETIQSIIPSSQAYNIFPLHAGLSPQEQNQVFKPLKPGVCKIVVATNVAETSITIDGVVYVIDTGRVKETQYNATTNIVQLVETWTSRASARQRRGRAGRTRPGQCFKLYSRDTEKSKMHPQQSPEMLRIPLEQICLQVKAMRNDKDVKAFLSKAIDPPSTKALKNAIQTLIEANALTEDGSKLTALGKHMASIPADFRISKMLLFGAIFRCLDPILTIAAMLSDRSPFFSPMDKREEAKSARDTFLFGKSDLLTDWKAFDTWDSMRKDRTSKSMLRSFCEKNFLSYDTLNDIAALKQRYLEAIAEIGFLSEMPKSSSLQYYNANMANTNLLKSIIFAGLYPNLVKVKIPDAKFNKLIAGTVEREREAKELKYFTKADGRVFIHPSSTLFTATNFSSPFVTYFSKIATSKTFIRDGTEVPFYALLLFGGPITVDHLGRGILVGNDGWIKLKAWARIGVLSNQLKRLLDAILDAKIEDPNVQVSSSQVIEAMLALISTDGI